MSSVTANPRTVEAPKTWGGIILLASMILIIVIGATAVFYVIRAGHKTVEEKTAALVLKQEKNKTSMEEVGYYETHKGEIDVSWMSIRNSLPGPQRIDELSPFPTLSLQQILSTYNTVAMQPGFSMSGQSAEFQKLADAVSVLEMKYPLVQFTELQLKLPENMKPMPPEATYLNMSAQLFMPR